MSGICGIFGPPDPSNRQSVEAMNLEQFLRGPDEGDISQVKHDMYHLTLGHRRMSVLDLQGGKQPLMDFETGSFIVFDGEIYNYRELRDILEAAGCIFYTKSDTEVLLKGYFKWGLEILLRRVDGMYAFAIWDEMQHRLLLARDPVGQKPLYYTGDPNGKFAFASSIAALKYIPWVDTSPDMDGLSLFLSLRTIPAPYTAYKHVKRLEPGACLIVDSESQKHRTFWTPFKEPTLVRKTCTTESIVEEYWDKLDQSVRDCLIADVPVSLMLSSGLDSSAIAISLARQGFLEDIEAYTVVFQGMGRNEGYGSRIIAKKLGLKHKVLPFKNINIAGEMAAMMSSFDEPFGDAGLLPSRMMYREIAKHTTAAIGGDGCDELFGGYSTFTAIPFLRMMNLFPGGIHRLVKRFARIIPDSMIKGVSRKTQAERFLNGVGFGPPEAFMRWLSVYTPDQVGNILLDGNPDVLEKHISSEMRGFRPSDLTDLMSRMVMRYFLPGVLERVDRASMSSSFEVRTPFLQRRMVQFGLALPSSVKSKNFQTKWINRQALSGHLPESILKSRPGGFQPPVSAWMSGPSGAVLEKMLRDSAIGDLVHSRRVLGLLADHRAKVADHSQKLWLILVAASFFANETGNTRILQKLMEKRNNHSTEKKMNPEWGLSMVE